VNPSGRAKRTEQGRILQGALDRARAAGARGVVVFDLDSTLLDNRPRQAKILAEYGASVSDKVLSASRAEHWQGWDMRVAMRNSGLPEPEVQRHYQAARDYWKARFFTSTYCPLDVPIPGAGAYLARVLETGAQIAYVTGRHLEMGDGTLETFRLAGFPIPDKKRVHLLLKPTMEMHDDAWKADAHARLDRLGQVVAAFDNEPAHVNAYADTFPGAQVIHLDTDHSGRPVEVYSRIPSVLDFEF
jgi:hypothetical protein